MPIPILGVAHVNLNCRDLDANRTFFGSLGLSGVVRTDPPPQDCRAFGFVGDAQWDAWMLQVGDAAGGTSLDLLESWDVLMDEDVDHAMASLDTLDELVFYLQDEELGG